MKILNHFLFSAGVFFTIVTLIIAIDFWISYGYATMGGINEHQIIQNVEPKFNWGCINALMAGAFLVISHLFKSDKG